MPKKLGNGDLSDVDLGTHPVGHSLILDETVNDLFKSNNRVKHMISIMVSIERSVIVWVKVLRLENDNVPRYGSSLQASPVPPRSILSACPSLARASRFSTSSEIPHSGRLSALLSTSRVTCSACSVAFVLPSSCRGSGAAVRHCTSQIALPRSSIVALCPV